MDICIGFAFFGGVLMAIVGFLMIFLHAGLPNDGSAEAQKKSSHCFRDGQIVILISAVPQVFLLTLLIIYDQPPGDLEPLAVLAGCAMIILWCWVVLKFIQSGRGAHPRITLASALVMLLPVIGPIGFFIGMRSKPSRPMRPVITVTHVNPLRRRLVYSDQRVT